MLNISKENLQAAGNPTKLEVLNISNVNGSGEVVLNDLRLLELVQLYPFLYNPRVRPFQDYDYDEWAWNKIATAFNRSYHDPFPPFSVPELQQRWHILVPIIKSLSKAHDIKAIPESLRQLIIKMSVQLEDQTTESAPKQFTSAQSLILANIPMVERLPLVERKRLEAELMELILANELEMRATVKMDASAAKRVEEEYDEFLQTIRVKELFVISTDEEPPVVQARIGNNDVITGSPSVGIVGMETDNLVAVSAGNKISPGYNALSPPPAGDNCLLEPLQQPRWVPLHHAHFYVRPCVVRVKRTNMEEYIPLAKIKRERLFH